MGGCYERSYCYSSRRTAETEEDSTAKLIRKLFATKKPEDVIKAAKSHEKTSATGFFKKLMDFKGVAEAPKELPDFEIESKLEILLTAENGAQEPTIQEIMAVMPFPTCASAQYIMDAINTQSVGQNSFFGSGNEEKFVVIEKGGKWYLKEKGSPEQFSFGIPGEQIVMKRRETRVETNPLLVAQTVLQKYAREGVEYKGVITKTKTDSYVMSTLTGRMYGMTVSDARTDGKRQLQLEVEYAGYIPGLTLEKGDERAIVQDIVNINRQIVYLCSGREIKKGWTATFAPTTERKYDFVARTEKNLPEERELLGVVPDARKARAR